ncbi:hypothetical protein ABT024_12575 [Streptomyces sp. NPDC002812]|uniref:hypothetical protein n=1 Tax=Streptomyces sp. NPDC002812 TaxID=3154434 RepID=UPI0033248795
MRYSDSRAQLAHVPGEDIPPSPPPLAFYVLLAGLLVVGAVAALTRALLDDHPLNVSLAFYGAGTAFLIVGFCALAAGLHGRRMFVAAMGELGLDITETIRSTRKLFEADMEASTVTVADPRMASLELSVSADGVARDLLSEWIAATSPDWIVESPEEEHESAASQGEFSNPPEELDVDEGVEHLLRKAIEKVTAIEFALIETGAYKESHALAAARRSALGVSDA